MSQAALPARFLGIDLRSAALLRVGLAALLLADLAYRLLDFEAFHTDAGVLPVAARQALLPEGGITWSLHLLGGSPLFQGLLFALAAGFAVALAFGWHTWLATFGSWLLLTSLHNRNPLILVGGDSVLRLLLFWSLFVPLGARASLDARRRNAPHRGSAFVSVGSAALLLQVAIVYPIAAYFKHQEPVWQELRFLEEAMRVDGVASGWGRLLLDHAEWLPALSWGALQLESFGVLLAFSPLATGPLRTGAVALFVGFHLIGIGATFHVGLFEWVMAVAWTAFLPGWFWDALLPRLRRRLPRGAPERAPSSREGSQAGVRPVWTSLPVQFLAGAFLICVAIQNVWTLIEPSGILPPGPVRFVNQTLRLSQRWSLWSNVPTNRYYVFAAHLRDGRDVDLHRGGAPLDWDSPRRRSRSNHWWKYQLSLSQAPALRQRELYADYLIRSWDREHLPAEHVEALELWMLEDVREPGGAVSRRRVLLWRSVPEEEPTGATPGVLD